MNVFLFFRLPVPVKKIMDEEKNESTLCSGIKYILSYIVEPIGELISRFVGVIKAIIQFVKKSNCFQNKGVTKSN